ncbi:MAG: hypothetical protein RIC55_13075 [Pirellulaceae bacterium]
MKLGLRFADEGVLFLLSRLFQFDKRLLRLIAGGFCAPPQKCKGAADKQQNHGQPREHERGGAFRMAGDPAQPPLEAARWARDNRVAGQEAIEIVRKCSRRVISVVGPLL